MHYLLRLPLTAFLGVASLAGCATGDAITSGAGLNGGDASGGMGTGANGQGGEAGSAQESSSSTGIACDELPCKLVAPQCGCSPDLACTVDDVGARLCAQKGSGGPGAPCGETALCDAGLICVGYGEGLLSCSPFCESDDTCEGPGGKCELTLEGLVGTNLCSENCDLVTNQGCALAGTSCQLGVSELDVAYTLCAPSGGGVEQVVCAGTEECAPGFICLETAAMDMRCFKWCDVGIPSCPADYACSGLDVTEGTPLMIGNVHYGVCNPS